MSTKVYGAMRCPMSKLKPSLLSIREQMLKAVERSLRDLVAKSTVVQNEKDNVSRVKKVFALLEESSAQPYHDPWSLDCGLSVWIDGNYAYLWMYGESCITKHIKRPKGVVDYSFWNNTDRPKNVSERVWKSRGKVWDRLANDETRMAYQVANFSKGSYHPCRHMVWEVVKDSLPKESPPAVP